MSKLEPLSDVSGIPQSSAINENNDRLQAALENTLSRDGSTPNEMNASLDMNGKFILNLPTPAHNSHPATKAYVDGTAIAHPSITQANVGAALWPQTTAENAAGVTPTDYAYEPGNILRYGTNTAPGTTDMTAAIQAAADQMVQTGGADMVIPPGTYLCGSQVTITARTLDRCSVFAYGAEITTSGAISGIAITGGATNGGITVYGLQINHRGNSSATAGFDLYQTWNARLTDCSVEAHGVGASYAAFRLRNGTAANNDTGCFWTVLDHCHARKRSGADSGDITYGIWLRGAANATVVRDCSINNTTTAIYLSPESGQTYISNGVLITGTAIETFTTGIHAEQATAGAITGLRIIGNRAESGTTFVSLTGATSQPLYPVFLAGNYLVADVTNYINNPNSLYAEVLDFQTGGVVDPSFSSNGGLSVRALSGSAHPITARTTGGGRGISLQNSSGTQVAALTWSGTSTGARLQGVGVGGLAIISAKSISVTATEANNLRGSATLSGGTANVTFSTAESDASYYVYTGCSAAESISVTSKATTGFTLTSSNGSSTATVDWLLVR